MIETVLLYHVVAGKTLAAGKVARPTARQPTTAQGGTMTVNEAARR